MLPAEAPGDAVAYRSKLDTDLYALAKAADVCARVCATHLLTRDLGYCGQLAPPLFLRVVEAVECTSPEQSIALSDHVAAYVNAQSPPLEHLGPLPLIDVTMLEGLTAKLTQLKSEVEGATSAYREAVAADKAAEESALEAATKLVR